MQPCIAFESNREPIADHLNWSFENREQDNSLKNFFIGWIRFAIFSESGLRKKIEDKNADKMNRLCQNFDDSVAHVVFAIDLCLPLSIFFH